MSRYPRAVDKSRVHLDPLRDHSCCYTYLFAVTAENTSCLRRAGEQEPLGGTPIAIEKQFFEQPDASLIP